MMTPGSFDVTPMGASSYSIPIVVPPGTNGVIPALSFDYSSNYADGTMGLGWTLGGLPSITRCPRTVAQDGIHGSVNYDSGTGTDATNDRFCMSGQRLVLVNGNGYGTDGSVYRTEVESFAKIIAHGTAGNGPQFFDVYTKSGKVLQFGGTADSRLMTLSASGQVGSTVVTWLVNEVRDTRYNYYTVSYINDTTNGSPAPKGQAYPHEIQYTGNQYSSPVVPLYNSVVFNYISRNDQVPMYQAGMVQTATQLLTDVQTYAGSAEVFDYHLIYKTTPNDNTAGAFHNELTSVKQCDGTLSSSQCGACDPTASLPHCLPPISIGWQGGVGLPAVTEDDSYTGLTGTGPSLFSGDFNGDGLTDLVTMGCPSGQSIQFGTQAGTFVPSGMTWGSGVDPLCMSPQPYFPVTVGDINGDGFSDIVTDLSFIGGLTQQNWWLNNETGSLSSVYTSVTTPPWLIADFNGDSRIDTYMISGAVDTNGFAGTAQLNFGSGDGTFNSGATISFVKGVNEVWLPASYAQDFDGSGCADLFTQGQDHNIRYSCNPAVASVSIPDWADQSQHEKGYTQFVFGDFNGDGKTDILALVSNGVGEELNPYPCGQATMYLSTGTSLAPTSFPVPNDWCYYQVEAGDFSGDGKSDLVLIPQNAIGRYGVTNDGAKDFEIWLSNGTGFFEAKSIANLDQSQCTGIDPFNAQAPFPPNGCDNGYVGDWNSDGASDLWVGAQGWNGVTSGSVNPLFLFDYVPELVTTIDNNIGSKLAITYDRINKNLTPEPGTSTPFYTKGTGAAYPIQNFDGPIYVVAKVSRSNGIGGTLSSTYSYTDARKDVSGRGFLGFRTITESTPTESTPMCTGATNQTLVTETEYKLDFPLTGQIEKQQKIAQSSACAVTLSETDNTPIDQVNLPVGLDGVKRYFVAVSTSKVLSNDLNGLAFPTVTTNFTYDCDSVSPCYGEVTKEVVSRSDGSSITTQNTFADDPSIWLLGLVSEAKITSVVGSSTVVHDTINCYDTTVQSCPDPNSHQPSGVLMQKVTEPTATDVTVTTQTNYTYDTFGNATQTAVEGCIVPGSGNTSCTTNATRTSKAQYDLYGQFQTLDTNALGQTETWTHNPSFGGPATLIDPNNLETKWYYDNFGRLTEQLNPDQTQKATAYKFCAGTNGGTDSTCPLNGAFSVNDMAFGSDGATLIGPSTRYYDDGLARRIANDTQGFSGCWARTDTIYDAYNNVYEIDRPHYIAASGCTAQSPAYTTNTTIDATGRPLLVTYPNCGTTATNFQALKVTVVKNVLTPANDNCAGTVSTEQTITIKNAEGMIASVENAKNKTTTYVYDAFNNLLTATDPLTNVVANAYDTLGRKVATTDPDLGNWTYVYDGFGELYQQTNARLYNIVLEYNAVGQTTHRSESGPNTTWTYGVSAASHNVGKLINAAMASSSYNRALTYDAYGRPSSTLFTIGSTNYTYTIGYDAVGRIGTISYPSGAEFKYVYNSYGYPTELVNASSGTVYWQVNNRDAEGHWTNISEGGLPLIRDFDPNSGLVEHIYAGASDNITNGDYTFDTVGNLVQRSDHVNNYAEYFCYDVLNRLLSYGLSSSTCPITSPSAVAVSYDSIGNINSKTDVGTYSYGTGSPRPHAVASITGANVWGSQNNPTFVYDADGNMTCAGVGANCGTPFRSMTYTPYDMTASIKQGATELDYSYDDTRQRFLQQTLTSGTPSSTTTYLNAAGVMAEADANSTGAVTWHSYLMLDGEVVVDHIDNSGGATNHYFVNDNLGSVATVVSSTQTIVQSYGYDAWGARRNANGSAAPPCSITASATTRGYTNQEMLDSVCMVNLNARDYDPIIARLTSADTEIPDQYDAQSYNRYSYVNNGPLSATDPTGHSNGNLSVMQEVYGDWGNSDQYACRCTRESTDSGTGAHATQNGVSTGFGGASSNNTAGDAALGATAGQNTNLNDITSPAAYNPAAEGQTDSVGSNQSPVAPNGPESNPTGDESKNLADDINKSQDQIGNGNESRSDTNGGGVDQSPDPIPYRFKIEPEKTQPKDEYSSWWYYQLYNKEDQALTGSGYSLEEHVLPVTGVNSNKKYVPLNDGEAKDNVGFTGPQYKNKDLHQTQGFTVQFEGKYYPLTTVFGHEEIYNNGTYSNNVTDIVP